MRFYRAMYRGWTVWTSRIARYCVFMRCSIMHSFAFTFSLVCLTTNIHHAILPPCDIHIIVISWYNCYFVILEHLIVCCYIYGSYDLTVILLARSLSKCCTLFRKDLNTLVDNSEVSILKTTQVEIYYNICFGLISLSFD